MKRGSVLVSLLLGFTLAAEAATRNVFFAGGQSNAKAQWATAIASGLQAGYGSNLVMVWTNHSGEAMDRWFTTEPRVNYSNDLFNASGTGLLQAQIHALTNSGDQVIFRGLFWFQGESDTGNYSVMDAYTNRFNGMLAQLKQDMGLTNDVRFSLAIIDAKPGAAYDDALAAIGRTREMVDYLRTNQLDLGRTPQGSYVDTRGYERSDVWHLLTSTPDELSRLGLDMSGAYTNQFGIAPPPSVSLDIVSHAADGCIYPTGTFIDNDLICGFTGSPVLQSYNGVAFFQLPTNRIEAADLAFKVYQNNGPLQGANLDVWGLGYVSAPAMSSTWMLLADTDARSPINYNVPATKLADNLLASGQSAGTVGTAWSLNAAQRTNLTAFLNGLYEKGALPGDYAVIRVNPDAVLSVAQNIRFGGSARTSPDYRSRLTVTLADAPVSAAVEGVFQYYSHASDGGVFSNGTSTANDLMSSTGGTGTQDYNGVAFFALPEQPMTAASLYLPVVTFSGVMVGANIDVWGLGYQSVPALTTAWFCTNDVDSRVLLNGFAPVKLADNIVTSGQASVSGNYWRPTASQAKDFRKYLNGLYNRGAKPGDYAVIRVNMDKSQAGVSRGVRWGGSQQASPNSRAMMSGIYPLTSNHLANAGFESGTGTLAANWAVTYNSYLGVRTNATPRSGSAAFRFAVNGDQSTNVANNINISQYVNIASVAGRIVTFSCNVRHNSDEPLVTNSTQKVDVRLWWLNGGVPLPGYVDSLSPLLPTDAKDVYKQVAVTGQAPTNATGVIAQVIFRTGTGTTVGNNPAITTGAVIVDDLRVSLFEPIYPEGSMIRIR